MRRDRSRRYDGEYSLEFFQVLVLAQILIECLHLFLRVFGINDIQQISIFRFCQTLDTLGGRIVQKTSESLFVLQYQFQSLFVRKFLCLANTFFNLSQLNSLQLCLKCQVPVGFHQT